MTTTSSLQRGVRGLRRGSPGLVGALLAAVTLLAGCDSFSSNPPTSLADVRACDDSPIAAKISLGLLTLSIDTNGTVKVIGETGVSAHVGPFAVGATVSYEKELAGHCSDAILLVERPVSGREMVTAYRLNSDQPISWATCGDQRSTWDPAKNALYVKLGRGAAISLVGGDIAPRRPRCAAPPKPRATTTPRPSGSSTASTTSAPSAVPPPEQALIPDASAAVITTPRPSP